MECAIFFDTFGRNIAFAVTQEEFLARGFLPGDGVNVVFSGGTSFFDILYCTGMLVKDGSVYLSSLGPDEPLKLVRSNANGMWGEAGVFEQETVQITRATPQKYRAVQKLNELVYTDNRADYPSDEAFVNFRAVSGGRMQNNFLYRGASPWDERLGRHKIVDALIKKAGIQTVLSIPDSEEGIAGRLASNNFDAPYYSALYKSGRVIPLAKEGREYRSADFAKRTADGLRCMISAEGPFYIHCLEGKTRTGFICMLLEILAGFSYEELVTDYMQSYVNYYRITMESDPEDYSLIKELKFDEMLSFIAGGGHDFISGVRKYLRSGGMTDKEIDALVLRITG